MTLGLAELELGESSGGDLVRKARGEAEGRWFHDLLLRITDVLARSPVVPVPSGFRCQPIDTADVAVRLAELCSQGPQGRVADLGGPEVLPMSELVRMGLAARGRRRVVVRVPVPGAISGGYREGHHLTPRHPGGRTTYADFLRSL